MPTVLRIGSYRFFFYSGDREEPRHVHVERDSDRGKFWLDPVRLADSGGFGRAEIKRVEALVETTRRYSEERGMSISPAELRPALAQQVSMTDDGLVVDLLDGRTVSVPLSWYPRLVHGTAAERANWRLIGRGEGIHWSDLDEDISVAGLLAGRPSGESPTSLGRWLRSRAGAP